MTNPYKAINHMSDAGQLIMQGRIAEFDPRGKDQHSPGAKLDAGKTRVHLMICGFHLALLEVAKVTTIGAVKYTPNGWHSVENGEARYQDAAGRHYLLGCGELKDAETGMFHDAQEIWNLLAAFQLKLERLGKEEHEALKQFDN